MFRKTRFRIMALMAVSLVLLFAATFSVIVITEQSSYRKQSREMLSNYISSYDVSRYTHGPAGNGGSGLSDTSGKTGEITLPDMPNQAAGQSDAGEYSDSSAGGSEMQTASQPGPLGPEGQTDPSMRPGSPGDMPKDEPLFNLSSFYSVSFASDGSVLAVDRGNNGLYTEEELTGIASGIMDSGKQSGLSGSLYYSIKKTSDYTLVAFIDNTVNNSNMRSLVRHTLIVGLIALAVLLLLSLLFSGTIVKPLEENDRLQKQFVSDAGHELKTPISVISANSELLSRQIGPNEWLDNIKYENERMGSLVIDLLELSRAENPESLMEPTDLSYLVLGELLPFESVAFEKGLEIKSDVEDGITVSGNRVQLSQLVHILLDNAVEHSKGGKEIDLTLKKANRHAVLEVVNSGDDIPPEKRERLFERFYRVDEARSGDDTHYGLGLAIAKAITERHGGSIGVSCSDGKITFTVNLPM